MSEFRSASQILKVKNTFPAILAEIVRDQGVECIGHEGERILGSMYHIAYGNDGAVQVEKRMELREVTKNIIEAYQPAHEAQLSRIKHDEMEHTQDIKRSQQALNSMLVDIRKLGIKYAKVIGSEFGVQLTYPPMTRSEENTLREAMDMARFYKLENTKAK